MLIGGAASERLTRVLNDGDAVDFRSPGVRPACTLLDQYCNPRRPAWSPAWYRIHQRPAHAAVLPPRWRATSEGPNRLIRAFALRRGQQ